MDHVRETFLPKDDVFQVKRILDDASGGHSNTKHVLLRRHERRHGNPVNVSQVTVTLEDKVLSLILEKGDVSIPLPGSHPDSERLLLRFMRSISDSEPAFQPSSNCFGENMGQKLHEPLGNSVDDSVSSSSF